MWQVAHSSFFCLSGVSNSLNDPQYPRALFQATNYNAIGLTNANGDIPAGERLHSIKL